MRDFFNTKRRDHIIALTLCLGVFGVYLRTMATSVEFIDSGELATVPFVLGIAHPTGYPLWTLIARIFTLLPIANEEIVRLNIFSAAVTACAAAVFFYVMLLLLRAEGDDDPRRTTLPALFSSLFLAFSQTFWDQSTSIEVYSLHLLLAIAAMFIFIRAVYRIFEQQIIDQRLWWLFAFVLGLSFTNHLTTILLAPAFLFLYFSALGFSQQAFRQVLRLAVPFVLGLSVYAYFPVRAAEQPVLNWGYPATLERIVWHITAKQYRVWMFSSSSVMAKQWKHFIDAVPKEFYYVPIFFSALGAWRLVVNDRRILVFILLLLGGCIAYTINYDIKDIDSYFLLAYIALAMLAGVGLAEVGTFLRKRVSAIGFIGLLSIFIAAQISANWSEVDGSDNHLVEDYTRNMLGNLQPNAIILSYQWDYFVAASYYIQYVKHVRQDVTVIDKELLRRSWYFLQIKKDHTDLYEKSRREIENFLEELTKFEHDTPYDPAVIEAKYNRMIDSFIDYNIDRTAVYVTPEIESHLASHYIRIPEGFAYRLYRDTTYHATDFPAISYRPYRKANLYTQQIHHLYTLLLTQRSLYEEAFGKIDLARRYAAKVYEINPTPATSELLRRMTVH